MTRDIPGVRDYSSGAGRQLRAFLYARASVDHTGKGSSTKAQLRVERLVCADHDWAVAGEFPDDDRSASTYAQRRREKYDDMWARASAGEADIILACDTARLWRNVVEFAPKRDLCQTLGLLLCIDGEIYDMRIAKHRQRLTREVAEAEAEADSIQARNARTAKLRVIDGGVHGKPLLGYRREYDPQTRELVGQFRDEQWAPLIVEIKERVAAREGLITIARDLDRRGIPTPGGAVRWNTGTVRNIALNPAYIGMRKHKGQLVPGVWEPIVDEDVHHAAVAVLRDPDRRTQQDTRPKYLLTGIPRCGRELEPGKACGAQLYRMPVSNRRGGHKRYPSYQCRECYGSGIRTQLLDDWVEDHVLEYLSRPGIEDRILQATGLVAAREALTRMKRLEAELQEAYAEADAGNLSIRGLGIAERRLLPQIKAARELVQSSGPPPALAQVAGADVREKWASPEMTVAIKRKVIRATVSVTVFPTPKGPGGRVPSSLPKRVRLQWLLDRGSE